MTTSNGGKSTAVSRGEKIKMIGEFLRERRDEIANAVPRHLDADRMLRVALTTITKTPALAECTIPSLYQAILEASQLGLEPDGILGQAYLVPYKDTRAGTTTATLQLGYQGLLTLARRSGQIDTLHAQVVKARDVFEFDLGVRPTIHRHQRSLDADRGETIAVYAAATFVTGGHDLEIMSASEVNAIRDKTQAYRTWVKYGRKGPCVWHDYYDEMARKTVLRRLCKRLPLAPEVARAVATDAARDGVIEASGRTVSDDGLDALTTGVHRRPRRQEAAECGDAGPEMPRDGDTEQGATE